MTIITAKENSQSV